MAAGDKEGHLAFWSLPSRIEAESLPQLENGMRDISELGECCQFKLSHEYCLCRVAYKTNYTFVLWRVSERVILLFV